MSQTTKLTKETQTSYQKFIYIVKPDNIYNKYIFKRAKTGVPKGTRSKQIIQYKVYGDMYTPKTYVSVVKI